MRPRHHPHLTGDRPDLVSAATVDALAGRVEDALAHQLGAQVVQDAFTLTCELSFARPAGAILRLEAVEGDLLAPVLRDEASSTSFSIARTMAA